MARGQVRRGNRCSSGRLPAALLWHRSLRNRASASSGLSARDDTGQFVLRIRQLEPSTGIVGRVGQQRFEEGDGLAVGRLRLAGSSGVF